MASGNKNSTAGKSRLLSEKERQLCQAVSQGPSPNRERALAILAVDNGHTQASAAKEAGLSVGQVQYWLRKFRQQRLAIFPDAANSVSTSTANGSAKPQKEAKAETVADGAKGAEAKSDSPKKKSADKKGADKKAGKKKGKEDKTARKNKGKKKKKDKDKPKKDKKGKKKSGKSKKSKKGKKNRKKSKSKK